MWNTVKAWSFQFLLFVIGLATVSLIVRKLWSTQPVHAVLSCVFIVALLLAAALMLSICRRMSSGELSLVDFFGLQYRLYLWESVVIAAVAAGELGLGNPGHAVLPLVLLVMPLVSVISLRRRLRRIRASGADPRL